MMVCARVCASPLHGFIVDVLLGRCLQAVGAPTAATWGNSSSHSLYGSFWHLWACMRGGAGVNADSSNPKS